MRKENLNRFKDSTEVNISNHYYLVYKPLIRDIIYAIDNYSKGRVLDVGCGNKPYKKLFNYKCDEYLGCDIVQSSENCVDIICEATKIPQEDNSFDTIFCTQVIEHVDDQPHDFFRFTKYGFKYIFEKQGFEMVETRANGGKWATFGQMVIHTFPYFLVKRKVFRKYSNMFFSYLDTKYYNDYNTMNYVVIAKK
jgi:ubiquinone/menaquinone biosynthesis C-methylase UbiE